MTGAGPIVSVVVPAFNAERYILETVESVLAQTLRELELIIVDDGSTDGTAAITMDVADPRVRVLRKSNGGVSAARNHGWRGASPATYIAFLDADDRWDRTKLERQVAFLNERVDYVATGCFMRYISSSGRSLGRTGQTLTSKDHGMVARGELMPFPLSSVLIRRNALEETGGFDIELGRPSGGAEDLDLLARLAQIGLVGCTPVVLGSYRIHPASAMARDRLRISREARFVCRRLALRQAGLDLTWAKFVASERESWQQRIQDRVEVFYRTAALWYGERRLLRALGYGALAALLNPRYTLCRLYRQRFSRPVPAPLANGETIR